MISLNNIYLRKIIGIILFFTCIPSEGMAQDIYSLCSLPDNRMLLECSNGFFHSADNGISWISIGKNYLGTKVMKYHSDGFVYAGCKTGVYRSSDFGKTWNLLNSKPSQTHTLILTPAKLIIGAENGIFSCNYNGTDWSESKSLTRGIYSIAKTSKDNIVATTDGGTGLYRSNTSVPVNDWIEIPNGPEGTRVGLCSTESGDLYVAGSSGIGMFDGIRSMWSNVSYNLSGKGFRSLFYSSKYKKIFAGTMEHGIYQKTEADTTWINTGTTGYVFGFYEDGNGDIFAATGGIGGLYRSTDGGESWKTILPYDYDESHASYTTVVSDKGGYLYVTNYYGTLFRTTNNGTNWHKSKITSDGSIPYPTASIVDKKGSVYIATENYGLFRSTDKGNNWKKVTTLTARVVLRMGMDSSGNVYVCSVDGLFKTTDSGDSWNRIGSFENVFTMLATPSALYIGQIGSGVLRSGDNGSTWENLVRDNSVMSSMTTSSGNILAGSYSGSVYRSTDDGLTWKENAKILSLGLREFAQLSSGEILMAGYGGLYKSTDDGLHWVGPINNDIYMGMYLKIAESQLGTIFVGGYPNVLWTSTDKGMTWKKSVSGLTNVFDSEEQHVGYALGQNHPNPFNPSTIIRYSIPARSTVRISIFNTLGQKISEIVNETKETGSYEQLFNASLLSSGMYFYRIEAVQEGTSGIVFIDTKRMLQMR